MNRWLVALFLLAPLVAHAQANTKQLRVQGPRIMRHLERLSRYGANPQRGVSRVAYTDADKLGRAYAISMMGQAGLDVSIDAAGNILGSRPGSDSSLKPLLIGSHIDSVPEGGNYDGDVGSFSAIEVAQILNEQHVALRHPLQVIIFQNEEGGTFGSHAVGSGLDEKLLNVVSQSGKTVRDGIAFIGGNPAAVANAQRQP